MVECLVGCLRRRHLFDLCHALSRHGDFFQSTHSQAWRLLLPVASLSAGADTSAFSAQPGTAEMYNQTYCMHNTLHKFDLLG